MQNNISKKIMLTIFSFIFIFSFMDLSYAGLNPLKEAKKLIKPDNGKKNNKLDIKTIIAGLKQALKIGTKTAVKIVSKANGYYKNPKIRIPLPEKLHKPAQTMRKIGLGSKVDELELKMNQAAEKAAKTAVKIFWNAIKSMSFAEARNILYSDHDNEATLYFERKTRNELYKAFFPIVKNMLASVGVTKLYQFLINKYNSLPLVKKVNYNLDEYVTNKALDGLFYMLANEERKIRKNPVSRTTKLLKKVFGSL